MTGQNQRGKVVVEIIFFLMYIYVLIEKHQREIRLAYFVSIV